MKTVNNEATKAQIKRFLEDAIENARKPDEKSKIKKKRQEKKQKVVKKYGF